MSSLTAFPPLRRTLTDVMEDELYHIPQSFSSDPSVATTASNKLHQILQHTIHHHQQQQHQQQHIGSNNGFGSNNFTTASPTLQYSKLFKNNSAINSEELLTIPEFESSNNYTSNPINNTSLTKVSSHDMYYDVPEQLPTDFNNQNINNTNSIKQIFNEFGDPNLTTTNTFFQQLQQNSSQQQHQPQQQQQQPQYQQPQQLQEQQFPTRLHHPQPFSENDHHQPTKLLKFNDDLTLDYFQGDNDDDGYTNSKFLIFPGTISPELIPEDFEDEELSDIEEDDEEFNDNDERFYGNFEMNNNNNNNNNNSNNMESGIAGNESLDIESDVDKMSLVSSDEEDDELYSSNSSVLDDFDTDVTPSFNLKKTQQPSGNLPQQRKKRGSINLSNKFKKEVTKSINSTTSTSNSNSTNTHDLDPLNNQHQCHLINSQTGNECLKEFSRPYDLIRHQETIHAERKKIFRCVVCNKLEGGLSKKTFSRGDALSRHVRVKHGLNGEEAAEAVKFAKDHVEYL